MISGIESLSAIKPLTAGDRLREQMLRLIEEGRERIILKKVIERSKKGEVAAANCLYQMEWYIKGAKEEFWIVES